MAKGKNPFGGGFTGGMNMQNMMKQAQKMIAEQEKMQEELKDQKLEASSGGGMVNAVVNGQGDLVSLKIKPECVDPEDVEMLEDLIISAITEAVNKSKTIQDEQMSAITGGLNIPGLNL